jgi:hypothetical protein
VNKKNLMKLIYQLKHFNSNKNKIWIRIEIKYLNRFLNKFNNKETHNNDFKIIKIDLKSN